MRVPPHSIVMYARVYCISSCSSTLGGDGNCTDMGGRSSRDCIVDTSNPSGIVIGLLYFIRKLPMMLRHGLCIRTRLPGPVVVTIGASVRKLVFATRRNFCERQHGLFFALTYVCSRQRLRVQTNTLPGSIRWHLLSALLLERGRRHGHHMATSW